MAAAYDISEHRLLDALLRHDLVAFTQRVFCELHPGKEMHTGWHHEAIAYIVDTLVNRPEMAQRAVINLPPRSLKSVMLSVALPAFLLGRDPTKKVIVVSYNQDLANELSRLTRQVMRSPWYRRLFPSTRLVGQPAVGQFYTTMGGFRAALSTGGTFTGKGGDIIIIDDPLKAADAYSETARRALHEWCETTLFSRLNDKTTGAIICVQQRQHEDDLSGYMLRDIRTAHLSLPAIAERDERICLSFYEQRFHTRRKGDLLDPVREPMRVLDDLRRQMGESAFLAQYQQAPVPPEGDKLKLGWFPRYRDLPFDGYTVLSIDTAIKGGPNNDYSAAILFRVADDRYYIESVWRQQVEFPDLLQCVKELYRHHRPRTILIEDKASGSGLIAALKADTQFYPVRAYDPGSVPKETRMIVQSHKIQQGQVLLPEEAPWLDEFLNEVRRFPNSPKDDQIDALSQFLDYMGEETAELFYLR